MDYQYWSEWCNISIKLCNNSKGSYDTPVPILKVLVVMEMHFRAPFELKVMKASTLRSLPSVLCDKGDRVDRGNPAETTSKGTSVDGLGSNVLESLRQSCKWFGFLLWLRGTETCKATCCLGGLVVLRASVKERHFWKDLRHWFKVDFSTGLDSADFPEDGIASPLIGSSSGHLVQGSPPQFRAS